jgi:P-type Ca2+ transporter type 2C
LNAIEDEKTPLQIQINNFVTKMSIIGLVIFGIVWGINYYNSRFLLDSLLKALTLAMSVIPEEIPVAFTTFMTLGAWRLLKMGIITKQTKTVETLGSATVICTDKTGTITENKMSLAQLYLFDSDTLIEIKEPLGLEAEEVINYAMWSSEPIPFDAMEIAIHNAYSNFEKEDERPLFKMIHEYPLSGKPPMMTHVFENESGKKIIAAKGAPEALIEVSRLSASEKNQVLTAMKAMTSKGFRVLGVGASDFSGNDYPETQQALTFNFKGLVAFYDPPKHNIQAVFETFYKAGIQVKIVTGDNAETTSTIAKQVGFKNADKILNGDELMAMDDATLKQKVMETAVFTRMFPEAKLKIIQALKANIKLLP